MNICHVNLASGYHGGENQTLLLIQQQIKLGYTLTVVANPKSPFFTRVSQLPWSTRAKGTDLMQAITLEAVIERFEQMISCHLSPNK